MSRRTTKQRRAARRRNERLKWLTRPFGLTREEFVACALAVYSGEFVLTEQYFLYEMPGPQAIQ